MEECNKTENCVKYVKHNTRTLQTKTKKGRWTMNASVKFLWSSVACKSSLKRMMLTSGKSPWGADKIIKFSSIFGKINIGPGYFTPLYFSEKYRKIVRMQDQQPHYCANLGPVICRLPSTIVVMCRWSPDGTIFAVGGYQTDLPEDERNVMHFITASGAVSQVDTRCQ